MAGPASTSRVPPPDPEVPAKVQRRRFSAEYRLRMLKQADACKKPGEVGALLRREGLYSSLLTNWRRQREQGALQDLRARPSRTEAAVDRPARHTAQGREPSAAPEAAAGMDPAPVSAGRSPVGSVGAIFVGASMRCCAVRKLTRNAPYPQTR